MEKKDLSIMIDDVKLDKYISNGGNYTGNIILNYRVIMLPPAIIDYVIVHELCHLIHHNHSKEFYKLITQIMPDWKVRKTNLNKYSLKEV